MTFVDDDRFSSSSSSFSLFLPTKIISDPNELSSCAIHLPIPLPPPVTTTLFFENDSLLKILYNNFPFKTPRLSISEYRKQYKIRNGAIK